MANTLAAIPFSVLDLAPIVQGGSPADSFQRSVALAQHVERLGFTRVWYAEHHNMENIASSATVLLITHVAEHTRRIRVGSGGIMLPNHAPLVVAEQFGTLECLFPGRIDLGLGRAPGTDQLTSMALRRYHHSVDQFPGDVAELRDYLAAADGNTPVKAVPGRGTEVPIWLLGSSTFSARLAGRLGLPFAFASHFAPAYLHEALQLYREQFRPSGQLAAPYAMACINVIAADTDKEAERLATSFYQMARGIVTNERKPLPPPVDSMEGIWDEMEKAAVMQMMRYSFIGSQDRVGSGLEKFVAETGVNELMIGSHIYDNNARLHSYSLLSPFFRKAL